MFWYISRTITICPKLLRKMIKKGGFFIVFFSRRKPKFPKFARIKFKKIFGTIKTRSERQFFFDIICIILFLKKSTKFQRFPKLKNILRFAKDKCKISEFWGFAKGGSYGYQNIEIPKN